VPVLVVPAAPHAAAEDTVEDTAEG